MPATTDQHIAEANRRLTCAVCNAQPGEPCHDTATGATIDGGAVHAERVDKRGTVIARHVTRRRRDGINYEVLTAAPGEHPKIIARFTHAGDAWDYAAKITQRVQEQGTPVTFVSFGI